MMKLPKHPSVAKGYAVLFDPGTALLTAAATLAQGRAARLEARDAAAQRTARSAQEKRAGAEAAAAIHRKATRRRATARAGLARAGVVLDGSPILRLGDMADVAARDAAVAERGARERAAALDRQTTTDLAAAENRQQANLLRAGTTLLRGFARFGR